MEASCLRGAFPAEQKMVSWWQPTRTTYYIYAPPVDLRAVCLVRAICQNQIVAEALVVLKRLKVVVGDQEVCGRSLNQCLPFKLEFMIAE